jgi:putative salt-induced outer membrane protein YdiY
MKLQTLTKALAACALAVCAVAQLSADVVETKSGARIPGKITKIDGTTVIVDTDFAGEIKVKQSEVTKIATDDPLNVRLEGGTVIQGTLSSPAGTGDVVVSGPSGTISSTLDKVQVTWAPGTTDPELAALQRGWAYEVAADITGKSGNTSQLGTSFSTRAVQKNALDTLQFYAAYDRQETKADDPDNPGAQKKTKSADQFKAGVDYANNFSGRYSWYVRDEGGFDRIKDIDLYNIAAAGFGYDFIKKPKHMLTGRAGVSFRYEGYKNPATEDVKAAGLDIGLSHQYDTEFWSLVNRITWVPLFEDFAN